MISAVLRSQVRTWCLSEKQKKMGDSNSAKLQGQRARRARPHGTMFPESQMAAQGGAGETGWRRTPIACIYLCETATRDIIILTRSQLKYASCFKKKGGGIGFSIYAKLKQKLRELRRAWAPNQPPHTSH